MGLASALAKAGMENAEQQEVTQFISTGYPPLDKAIAASYTEGGMPSGRIIEIFGEASCGKTAIASACMANAQKAGGFAIFQDHENSFSLAIAKKNGLNDDPDFWVYNKPDTFEESFEQVKSILLLARGMEMKAGKVTQTSTPLFPMDKPVIVVFDSLASMVPRSAVVNSKGEDKEASSRNMNDNTALARATSAHFPMLAMLCDRTNATIIFLNQPRTNLNVTYGDNMTTPGGKAPPFYASVRIKLTRDVLTEGSGPLKKKVGQRITAEVIKNKVKAPFQKASWNFLFNEDGTGKFDVINGIIDELIKLGKVEQSGAWITWEEKKWNSRKQLAAHIEDSGQYDDLVALLPA